MIFCLDASQTYLPDVTQFYIEYCKGLKRIFDKKELPIKSQYFETKAQAFQWKKPLSPVVARSLRAFDLHTSLPDAYHNENPQEVMARLEKIMSLVDAGIDETIYPIHLVLGSSIQFSNLKIGRGEFDGIEPVLARAEKLALKEWNKAQNAQTQQRLVKIYSMFFNLYKVAKNEPAKAKEYQSKINSLSH